ncbi:phosphotransferase [Solibacillus daqui]|uniref:phosphotransferase n=1 Tax=Solibacillus daqui TaxID=2912187 RepID=UPI002367078F|nr:phosphotransferase [Solibacillus daqui]
MDFRKLQSFIENKWNITFQDYTIIRNQEKRIFEIITPMQTYIVKGEKQILQEVETFCQFANSLQTVLPISPYLQTTDSTFAAEKDGFVYTVEQKGIGAEIQQLNDAQIEAIGAMLGKLHAFSLKHKLSLHKATSWSMFGGNATVAIGDYDENELSFLNFKEAFQQFEAFSAIEQLYNAHRNLLKQNWSTLPKAATQGDFCYYNMLFENNKMTGIFDFNLAGDEILLNECIAAAVYCCWHVAYEGERSSEQRYQLFISGYQQFRPWASLENDLAPYLFAIIRAFRYDRVDKGIANIAQHKLFLQQTKDILSIK